MDISVIMSTWNNSHRLKETLEHFSNNLISRNINWELILINNNCRDDTDSVAETYLSRLPIQYIREPRQGLSYARNKGLEYALGQLIILADDDIKPCPEWLIIYWNAYQQKQLGLYFGGPVESEFESLDFDHNLLAVAPSSVKGFNLGTATKILETNEYFIGSNWACPSKALKDLKGFDNERGLNPTSGRVKVGEETDLMIRLNRMEWKGLYLPDAKIRHFVPTRKCSLGHIGSRAEAWGMELSGYEYNLHVKGRMVFGVPIRMYHLALIKYMRWNLKKIRGLRWYEEYMSYREYIGLIKGIREKCLKSV
jgi:glycosyltransferase involved in cell wall biosynthesis